MSNTEPLLSATLMRRLQTLSLSPFTTVGSPLKGDRLSYKRGVGQDFIDYRDYGPGDDPRYVDWNAAARTNKLFVRVFHEERDLKLVLVVDTSESMTFGQPTRLHFAAQIAAATGFVALCSGDRVTVQPFATTLAASLPPLRGKTGAPHLFNYLKGLTPGGGTAFASSLYRLAAALHEPSTVILASDLYDNSWRHGVAALLARGHQVILLHILTPQEFEPPLVGALNLVDCETGATLDVTITGTLLDRYTTALRSFIAEAEKWCTAHRVTYIKLQTTDPLEKVIMTTLRQKQVLR